MKGGRGRELERNPVNHNNLHCTRTAILKNIIFGIMAHIEKRKIQFKNKNISGKRAERNEIYNTRTWRNLRDLKLQQSPLCERCLKDGKINNATQVHHIESFMIEGGDRIELAFDINNLQSLCVKCHQLIHNRNERQ